MAADTGHGISLTFSGVTFNLLALTPPAETLTEHVEMPHVGLAIGARIPVHAGELKRLGPMTARMEYDPVNTTHTKDLDGTSATCTITWPISVSGNTTNATWQFTGVLDAHTPEEFTTGVRQETSFSIQPLSDITKDVESA